MILKSPYPWFGGKRRVAQLVWGAFGEVSNYVEPFFGSGAVLLARPDFDAEKLLTETVNDADGFVSNFWRALQADPDAVAHWCDWPVNECDLYARHGWLVNRRQRLTWSMEDPDFYDAKTAGWWVWGIASWIGSGWCSGEGPWVSNGAHIAKSGDAAQGIKRNRPHLGDAGQGINRKLPHLGDAGRGINRKLPHLGDAGRGINRTLPHLGNAGRGELLSDYLWALAERMRGVRVVCGDWSRVTGESVTENHGTTAIFLDPPYSAEAGRDMAVYAVDCGAVAHDVRAWCEANTGNPLLRIVLCGYEGEHDMPGWRCVEWKANGGYGNQADKVGRANAAKERLWLSPSCIDPKQKRQNAFAFETQEANS